MAGRSLNKVMLIGNLGKDPDVTYTQSGIPMAKFSLATNERTKDANDNWTDKTEWHNIVVWRKQAEIAQQYLKKGSKIYLEGKIQTRSWDDKNTGVKKYMTEIIGDTFIMLDSRGAPFEQQGAQAEEQAETGGAVEAVATNEKDDLPF